MKLNHRFSNDLNLIETEQIFCNEKIHLQSKILIIGTFNPDDDSYDGNNAATWFYGRKANHFWKYLPMNLTNINLVDSNVDTWKLYCVKNRIVIVDLIKSIRDVEILQNFKDKSLSERIQNDMKNVDIFNFEAAFKNITFDKVIYTRKGWDEKKNKDIPNLIQIKNSVNEILIKNKIVENTSNIYYCPAPWTKRKSTGIEWSEIVKK